MNLLLYFLLVLPEKRLNLFSETISFLQELLLGKPSNVIVLFWTLASL